MSLRAMTEGELFLSEEFTVVCSYSAGRFASTKMWIPLFVGMASFERYYSIKCVL